MLPPICTWDPLSGPDKTILHYLIPMFDQDEEKSLYIATDSSSSSIRSKLENRKKSLESDLAKVNAGIEALEKNPGLAETLETLTKAIRL